MLDVGCGQGILGAALKRRGAERVVGIELNPVAAEVARGVLDDVLVCDVEQTELPFEHGSFDVLLYGDVLEHLVDPWAVLRAHRVLLRPGGRVIVSVPNIGYWEVIRDLLRGRWEYASHGTLDATHLRFFTRRGLEALIRGAGLEVESVVTSIPARGKAAWLNRLTRERFEHLLVWRYVVVARISDPP